MKLRVFKGKPMWFCFRQQTTEKTRRDREERTAEKAAKRKVDF